MKKIKINALNLGTTLFLTYSFFVGLFVRYVPTSLRMGLLLAGFLCFFLKCRLKRGKQPLTVFLAIICIFIILFNRNARFAAGSFGIDVCIVIGLAVFCLASTTDKWHQSYYKFLFWMGIFYGVTTIFLFLFPRIYLQYVEPLFGTQRGILLAQNGYAVGFTQHYSTTAMYLSTGASTAVIPLLRGEVFDQKTKRGLILLFVIIYGAVLLTGKRAHSIFIIFAAVAAYWFLNKDKKQGRFFYLIAGLSAFVAVYIIAAHFYPPLYNIINRFEYTISRNNLLSGRQNLFLECLNMFKSSPLFGSGWGSYTFLTVSRFQDAHNVYLQLLAENGIILSIPFYAFFLVNWVHVAKAVSSLTLSGLLKNQNDTIMAGSALFFQTFFLFYCLSGNPLYDIQMLFPYFFTCSIGEYYYRSSAAMVSQYA